MTKPSQPMIKLSKNLLLKLLEWKNGRLVDILTAIFFLSLNLVYLWPFLGGTDKSNSFSAPLVPLFSYLISLLTGLEIAQAVVICLAIFMALGPVFLYFFAASVAGRRLAGFISALIYSLPLEFFAKGRIQMAFLVGDGGHLAALSLVPLVALFLLRFLRAGNFRYLLLASLQMALVALTSPFGLLSGGMVLLVLIFSELLQGQGRLKLLRFVVFTGLSLSLVSFWYNPGFVLNFLKSQQGVVIERTLFNLIPISFVVLPILGTFGFLLFEKKAHLQPLFIALGLAILFFLVSFAGSVGQFFPGHPRRYWSELGFSFAFLLGILLTAFSDYLRFSGKIYKVQLSPLGRSLARKSLWLSSMGLMGGLTLFSLASVWRLSNTQVLGLWDGGIATGGIWDIREKTSLAAELIGYLITFLAIWLVTFFWLRLGKIKPLETSKKN